MSGYEERTGGRVLAIPHNGNLSNGTMFQTTTVGGRPFDQAYAYARIRFEPIYWPARCFVPVGMRVYITGDTGDRDADGCGIARL